MIKMTVLLKRRADLKHEEFLSFWQTVQVPAVFAVPESVRHTRRYVMQEPLMQPPQGFKTPEWDGIAEAWFDDMEAALEVCYSQDFAKIVFPINEEFLDRGATQVMFSREVEADLSLYRLNNL